MMNETDQCRRDRMGIGKSDEDVMAELETKEGARLRNALRQITNTTTVPECQKIAREALGTP